MDIWRVVTMVIAGVAALLAAAAAVSAFFLLGDLPDDTLVVELWRAIGFATFAAIFALLALRPGRLIALWVIAFASKAALAIAGIVLGPDVPGAVNLVIWDGLLALLLLAGTVTSIRARANARATRAEPS